MKIRDDSMTVKDNVEIVVQINGKVREKLYVPNGLSKEDFQNFVLDSEKTKELVKDKQQPLEEGVDDAMAELTVLKGE